MYTGTPNTTEIKRPHNQQEMGSGQCLDIPGLCTDTVERFQEGGEGGRKTFLFSSGSLVLVDGGPGTTWTPAGVKAASVSGPEAATPAHALTPPFKVRISSGNRAGWGRSGAVSPDALGGSHLSVSLVNLFLI